MEVAGPLGTPLGLAQRKCLENPMDGGAWGATVHGVTKSCRGQRRDSEAGLMKADERAPPMCSHGGRFAQDGSSLYLLFQRDKELVNILPLLFVG